ncbi:MAG: 50S ribosomal protein L25 [Candidatus Paceibacterota bacterium]
MDKKQLKAEARDIVGRRVKSLRKRGFVPAVVYGHDFGPVSIQVPQKDFERVYTEAGESTIVYLNIGNEDHPTIIHDVMLDPVTDKFLHADFYKVRLDEKITTHIQLNFIGESPAVKELGGILVKNMSEIEVEGFPQDLPNKIDVDISALKKFEDQISIKDLPISDKLEVLNELEASVVLIQEPISEEELQAQLETPAGTAEDVEVIKKEKPEEEGEGEGGDESQPEQKEEKKE